MKHRRLRPSHIRDLKSMITKMERYFKRSRFYPRSNVYLDKVVLAHVSKALTVARSVLCLIEADLHEEAFGLTRTLVEVAFNLRFITIKNSENRARRFVHYFAVWRLEQIERAMKHFYIEDKKGRRPKYRRAQLRMLVPERERRVLRRWARKFPNQHSWTQVTKRKRSGAGRMAAELDRNESIPGMAANWQFDYDWIYFWTSQYVHATVVSMDSHAVVPRQAFAIHISKQQGDHTAGLAVFNTALYLSKVLVLAFRAIKYDQPEELLKPLGDMLADMASMALRE